MSYEQQAYEALALMGMTEQAVAAQQRRLAGGKRQRCVCGALEGESCRDHSQVMAFTYIDGELQSVEQGGKVLWHADTPPSTPEEPAQ